MSEISGAKIAGDDAGELQRVLSRFVPPWFPGELTDDLALGSEGLGLDSIAILELFIACEERFDLEVPDTLLEGRPLTIGMLTQHVERGRTGS